MTFQPSEPSRPSDEVVLSQEQLQKAGIIILCLVVLLTVTGFIVSPRDGDGQPFSCHLM